MAESSARHRSGEHQPKCKRYQIRVPKFHKFLDFFSFSELFEILIIFLMFLYFGLLGASGGLDLLNGNYLFKAELNVMIVNAIIISVVVMIFQLRYCFQVKNYIPVAKRIAVVLCLAVILGSLPFEIRMHYAMFKAKESCTVSRKVRIDYLSKNKGRKKSYYVQYRVDGYKHLTFIPSRFHNQLEHEGLADYCIFLKLKYAPYNVIVIDSWVIDKCYKDVSEEHQTRTRKGIQ